MPRFLKKSSLVGVIATLAILTAPAFAIGSSVANQHASAALAEAGLKSCQVRERVIDKIMARIADRGQRRLDVYSTIATRVEEFYTKKGKTVSNYDALVADVNTKKTAAQDAINLIKTDKANFKCDGTDPKGVASSFKTDLKAEIQALHAYQQSIKDLVVAVKSVQSDTSSSNSTNEGGSQQ